MTTIELFANDEVLEIVKSPTVSSGDVNTVELSVSFSPEWEGFTKVAVFFNGDFDPKNNHEGLLTNGKSTVPGEVIKDAAPFYIGIKGIKSDATKTTTILKYQVIRGVPTIIKEVSKDVYQQILAAYANLEAVKNAVDADAKQVATDRAEVKKMVDSVAGIDEQVAKVERLTGAAQQSATLAGQKATQAETAQGKAEQAKATTEQNAQQTTADKKAVETAKTAVENMKQAVASYKTAVEGMKQSIEQFNSSIPDAVRDGVQSVNTAKDTAVAKVTETGTSHKKAVEAAGTTAVQNVNNSKADALQAVEAAKTDATGAVTAEGAKQTKTVTDTGTQQTQAVTAEGQKQLTAVQQAAQEIVTDRKQIEKNKVGIEFLKQGKADAIVETVLGETIQAEDSSDLKFEGLRIFGKSIQDGTPSLESPVPITNVGDKGNITVTINGSTEPQSLTLQTPTGLPGLKVNKGGNYTDENGQQWVSNIICKQDGKWGIKRYIVEITIDQNTDLLNNLSIYGAPEQNTVLTRVKGAMFEQGSKLLCDKLRADENLWSKEKEGAYLADVTIDFRISKKRLGLQTDSTPEQNAIAVKKYLKTNPLHFIGQSKTSEFESFPEEMQQIFNALHTNYPTTEISNDESAHMEASYVADTKLYIAKKIKEAVKNEQAHTANLLSLMPMETQAAMIENDTNRILESEVTQ